MRTLITSSLLAFQLLALAGAAAFGAVSIGETTADANTVILDHLKGVSVGEARGGLGYAAGIWATPTKSMCAKSPEARR